MLSALQSDESGDLFHQMVGFLYEALIDAEATTEIQIERHERAPGIHARSGGGATTASTSAPIKMARPERYSQKMRIATPANAP